MDLCIRTRGAVDRITIHLSGNSLCSKSAHFLRLILILPIFVLLQFMIRLFIEKCKIFLSIFES